MSFKHPLIPTFLDRSWWDSLDYADTLWDQHFGTVLTEKDMYPPLLKDGYLVRPRTRAAIRSSGKSEVSIEKDKFVVKLSVRDFKVDELKVKICENHVVIEGKHEEKEDEHGSVERKFSRRYVLPAESDLKALQCTLDPECMLTIQVPKLVTDLPPPDEKTIPIMLVETAEVKK